MYLNLLLGLESCDASDLVSLWLTFSVLNMADNVARMFMHLSFKIL